MCIRYDKLETSDPKRTNAHFDYLFLQELLYVVHAENQSCSHTDSLLQDFENVIPITHARTKESPAELK